MACFDSVHMEGLKASVHTYTSIINAHVRSGEIAVAEEYLARMRKDGLAPNVVTYTTLLKGYTQVGNLGIALAQGLHADRRCLPALPTV